MDQKEELTIIRTGFVMKAKVKALCGGVGMDWRWTEEEAEGFGQVFTMEGSGQVKMSEALKAKEHKLENNRF